MTANPRPCPICQRPATPEHQPFCGRPCRDRDLLRWLDDAYRVPGPPADADGLDRPVERD